MSYREVKDSLCRLVSLSESESASADSLCKESLKEICAGLNGDADTEDPRVTAAATGVAFYKIMLKRNSEADEIESFKAGDLSISQGKSNANNQLTYAEKYMEKCIKKIIPLCTDTGFAVTNVEIEVKP